MRVFGVAETARLMETDIATIKKWCYIFQTYLSPQSNPEKGIPRCFTLEDIRVFFYIFMYWEEDPDIEYIKLGLDGGGQYDNLPIDNSIRSLMPVFSLMPSNVDDTYRGVVFGGEFELGDLFESANSFKEAGDRLIEVGIENYEERILFQPAMYSYRHALELYIKSISGEERNHNLKYLFEKLILMVRENWLQELPNWLHNLVQSFDTVDPHSTAFRYGKNLSADELYADMEHIKELMDWTCQVFTGIKGAKDNLTN